jgi:hypothetical protein
VAKFGPVALQMRVQTGLIVKVSRILVLNGDARAPAIDLRLRPAQSSPAGIGEDFRIRRCSKQ